MLKIENTDVFGWEAAIRGARNPMNSWEKSDTIWVDNSDYYHNINKKLEFTKIKNLESMKSISMSIIPVWN